jgi:hypothetical protein
MKDICPKCGTDCSSIWGEEYYCSESNEECRELCPEIKEWYKGPIEKCEFRKLGEYCKGCGELLP